MHLNIVQNRNKFFIFSGVLIIASILSLLFWGLKPGIDFTGGSLLEVSLNEQNQINSQEIAAKIQEKMPGLGEVRVQPTESGFILRLKHLSEEEHQQVLDVLKSSISQSKEEKTGQEEKKNGENSDETLRLAPTSSELAQGTTEVVEKRFESIGPIIGQELKNKAIWAIGIAMLAIIIYIAWSFRKISKPVASWKYGLGAVIALIHDLLIVTGAFSILGHFLGYEVDLLFVSALLTILGFSVHDTIVVYDRTRENLIYNPQKTFDDTVNKATNDTMRRSINTSLTVLLVLLALYFLGGVSTQNFVLALMIGVVIGTYSSIFVASTLLVVWQRLGRK